MGMKLHKPARTLVGTDVNSWKMQQIFLLLCYVSLIKYI